jgi:saccharopine dehydrogenase-like NADP-dependent oxidoreductase
VLTLGCGYIGSVLAKELAKSIPSAEIVISDNDMRRIDMIANEIKKDNVHPIQLDIFDYNRVVRLMKNFDLVVGLTPGRIGYQTMKASIQAGVNMVDLSYMPEDPLTLNKEALKAGITIIPDCGVAPGLSNILVGRAFSMLDNVKNVEILVGGLPQKPIPPLNYKVTWCLEDLIEEYVRKAKIVKDGKTIEVEALEGLEEIEFPGVSKLEAFYTDGIRTLHHTIKGVENMWEKTLRYPGHAEKIKFLRDLGFFDERVLEEVNLSPRELVIKILEHNLNLPEVKDFLLMKIKVNGIKGGLESLHSFYLLDRYDEIDKVTAMGRTTAYTAFAVIQLFVKGLIEEKGVSPPEKLGMNDKLFSEVMIQLRKKGIEIKEEHNE